VCVCVCVCLCVCVCKREREGGRGRERQRETENKRQMLCVCVYYMFAVQYCSVLCYVVVISIVEASHACYGIPLFLPPYGIPLFLPPYGIPLFLPPYGITLFHPPYGIPLILQAIFGPDGIISWLDINFGITLAQICAVPNLKICSFKRVSGPALSCLTALLSLSANP
jgi:hypothetical protein